MKLNVRKSVAAAAIVLTASATLAGCGDGNDSDAKDDSKSSAEGSGEELTQDNFFTEVADAQVEAKSSTFDLTMEAGGQAVTADGKYEADDSGEAAAMEFDMDMAGQKVKMIYLSEKFYINMPGASQGKFMVVDTNDSSNPMAKQLAGTVDLANPTKQFAEIEKGLTKFEKQDSSEKIDGADVTEYRISVDPTKVESIASEPGASQLPDEITYNIFIDQDNLPRRISMSDPVKMTANYTGWGEPVDIKAPPASDIAEAPAG